MKSQKMICANSTLNIQKSTMHIYTNFKVVRLRYLKQFEELKKPVSFWVCTVQHQIGYCRQLDSGD